MKDDRKGKRRKKNADDGTEGAQPAAAGKGARGLSLVHLYIALIILGVAFRAWSAAVSALGWDGTFYIAMGDSFRSSGFAFDLPLGDYMTDTIDPASSHHYSPLFPMYLAAWFSAGGCSIPVAKAAAFTMSILALAVVYWCTADLFGRKNGLLVTALMSLDSMLIISTGNVLAENLVLPFFALTMWAIVRGIKDDRYIVLAGLFAGMTYLAKASMGYFFIIAGLGGLGWRFYYMRWDVFRNRHYLLGIALFGMLVGGWSLRNIMMFGWPNWETSSYISKATSTAMGEGAGAFLGQAVLMLLFFLAIMAKYSLPWYKELWRTISKIKKETVSCLWLAVFLVPLTSLFIVTSLAMFEDFPAYNYDRIRYLFLFDLPLLWLVAGELQGSDHFLRFREGGIGEKNAKKGGFTGLLRHVISLDIRDVRGERRSFAWALAVGGLLLVAAALYHSGGTFLVLALGALCCAFVRPWNWRLLVVAVVGIIVCSNAATQWRDTSEAQACDYLLTHLRHGDAVALDRSTWGGKYHYYTAFYEAGSPRDGISVVGYDDNCTARYIVSARAERVYANYTLIASFHNMNRSQGVLTDAAGSALKAVGFPIRVQEASQPDSLFIWERNAG